MYRLEVSLICKSSKSPWNLFCRWLLTLEDYLSLRAWYHPVQKIKTKMQSRCSFIFFSHQPDTLRRKTFILIKHYSIAMNSIINQFGIMTCHFKFQWTYVCFSKTPDDVLQMCYSTFKHMKYTPDNSFLLRLTHWKQSLTLWRRCMIW